MATVRSLLHPNYQNPDPIGIPATVGAPPRNILIRRPAEPESSRGEQQGSEHDRRQSVLGVTGRPFANEDKFQKEHVEGPEEISSQEFARGGATEVEEGVVGFVAGGFAFCCCVALQGVWVVGFGDEEVGGEAEDDGRDEGSQAVQCQRLKIGPTKVAESRRKCAWPNPPDPKLGQSTLNYCRGGGVERPERSPDSEPVPSAVTVIEI
ncbi:uncharacterized protein BCR38DRAFT_477039 [Pseudomassariella vexata]|uniref:Uncharacterized protein n=1 Tax=Pseudomassariella vexata TaxID=1141098 RepID=A0A1Y2DM25_9PEZI|nr:uncharacterized protein BCR38DRAFT_477039 [Pseudomassariella vexata]ORY60204.1 hypothetical protein BCR38DRAFT_477039 [Pseudomassariella vexata]